MTERNLGIDPNLITTDLSHGPARLVPWMSALRALPYPLTSHLLATAAVAEGFVRNGRFRRALSWAGDRGFGGAGQWRLAVTLLANHGRFVAEEAVLGARSLGDLAQNVSVSGAERLANLQESGALLLGFHLGPPKTWLVLRALGYPYVLQAVSKRRPAIDAGSPHSRRAKPSACPTATRKPGQPPSTGYETR